MKALLTLAGIAVFLGVPLANATVEVRIVNTNNAGTTIIGDTGWIQCPDPSCSFTGLVGNYSFTSDVATKDNSINPFFDMSYSARTSHVPIGSAGTITIEAMADGYTTNTPQFEVVADGNSTLSTAANVLKAFGGNNNTICAVGTNTCTPGTSSTTLFTTTFSTPPNHYSVDALTAGNTANPYSLGLSFTITAPTTDGAASGDIQLDAVPEPAAVTLFGGVLLFTVTAIRRKVRRNA